MFKKDFNKGIKKMFASKGADPLKMEITPYRDWRIVVLVFFVGLLASLGFNIYMSIEINSDNFFTAAPKTEGGVVLNKDGLTKILSGFATKEALFEKTRTEKTLLVDPSL